MEEIVQLVSEVKKWSVQQTLGVTSQNAQKFFESGRTTAQEDHNTGEYTQIAIIKFVYYHI